VNKAELIDALTDRLGDRKTAAAAVDGLVDVVVRTVHKGDKVTITGFGVFEKRARAARVARNPRTGEAVKVKKTNVPAFRAGTAFKDVVRGAKKLPRVAATAAPTAAAGRAARTAPARSAPSPMTASRPASTIRATTDAVTKATTNATAKRSTKGSTKAPITKAPITKAPITKAPTPPTKAGLAAKPTASTAKSAAKSALTKAPTKALTKATAKAASAASTARTRTTKAVKK